MGVCCRRLITSINYVRSIMTSAPKLEKAIETLKSNPFYDKYADRIAALQKTSPEEFLERVNQTAKSKNDEVKKKFASVDTSQYSSVLNPKKEQSRPAVPEDKKLDSIMKLDLVMDKSVEEITVIWEQYHRQLPVISAVIPCDHYDVQYERTKTFPTFVFPLPRAQGYEFILCQASGHTLHFTPLLAYQVHKENAPECLTVTHYAELRPKGVVLMRGEYDKNVLSGQEAQCLANQFQMYYAGSDPRRLALLRTFSEQPDAFRHMELVDLLESVGL